MNNDQLKLFVEHTWDKAIIPALMDYIHIPNKSPMFDAAWEEHGYMEKAVHLISDWCKAQKIKGMEIEIVRLEGRTPLIFMEIPGQIDDTILLYGHYDKQPEMVGWEVDLAPWKAVLRDDKLYGRGGADDGYAAFASITAIKALQEQGIPHARCIVIIEGCEESGSYDLPYYMNMLEPRIGQPSLVICLDSGCGNYEQLWLTTSLRGLVGGVLRIDVLKQGVHSGYASGVVPSPFLVLRQLLSRLENETNGKVMLNQLEVDIPQARLDQAKVAANVLGSTLREAYPFIQHAVPVSDDSVQLILNRTWRAALSVVGAEGLPMLANAGNVTLPSLLVKLSMRLPPTSDPKVAASAIKSVLEEHPPFNARVRFDIEDTGPGWNAPAEQEWLRQAADGASKQFFGKEAVYMGEGGSIPFMGMLGHEFPEAQFVITGVLGPNSNAHGPNEFLHIPMGKKLTCCVAKIIADHFDQAQK